jgi:hypothetical protein
LKSVVGLSEQLRSAEAIIRRDLESVHLTTETGEAVRVSDPRVTANAWRSPNQGFFEVINTNLAGQWVDEGVEEGLHSYRVTGHSLAFTAQLPANSPENVFVGDTTRGAVQLVDWTTLRDLAPPPIAGLPVKGVAPVAELYYFLVPNGLTTSVEDPALSGQGVPLYTLCRRQALVAPQRSGDFNPVGANNLRSAGLPDLSFSTYPIYSITAPNPMPATPFPAPAPDDDDDDDDAEGLVPPMVTPVPPTGRDFVNSPSSLTNWRNRMRYVWPTNPGAPGAMPPYPGIQDAQRLLMNPNTPTTPAYLGYWRTPNISNPADKIGTEFLLTNVISFQIRPLFSGFHLEELPAVTGATTTAGNFPRLWDTGVLANRTTTGALRGLQLKLRIWDPKNKLTRQMTVSIDL